MMNRVTKTINENRHQFRGIKGLEPINYLYLIKDQDDSYSNEVINKTYDYWNRRYGNNITADENYVVKNNIGFLAQQIRDEFHKIEQDDNMVINSLVRMLYKKPSQREKKLLWFVYGEELFNNLAENLPETPICWKCGRRSRYVANSGLCLDCRKENGESGFKEIECVDCGIVFQVERINKRTIRCGECQKNHRKKMLWQRRNGIINNSEGE